MDTNLHHRGTLSSALANALSRLASEGKSVFTIDEFASTMRRSKDRTRRILSGLSSGGWVRRLTKGTYLLIPLDAGPESIWSEEAAVIAGHLAAPAALAYWSACHYWHWTEQAPRTVFVQTTQKKMHTSRRIMGVEYRFVTIRRKKFFAATPRVSGHARIIVTDREKTFVDAVDRPDLCGGIRHVIAMMPVAAERLRWNTLDEYLERIGSGAIYKRLGLMLDMLGDAVHVPDRDRRLDAWHTRLTAGCAPLEPGGPCKGPIDGRWRVRMNAPGIPLRGSRR